MRILVDRFIYQGFAIAQGDTPYLISPNAALLQDQNEKAHCRPRRSAAYGYRDHPLPGFP
jgi:hypothetical protein